MENDWISWDYGTNSFEFVDSDEIETIASLKGFEGETSFVSPPRYYARDCLVAREQGWFRMAKMWSDKFGEIELPGYGEEE